ncbi:cell division protein FtsQ [Betaproteobacteria bacterium]|nr:cell division protein FtsQ [Betaproteobacteria bacterium]
MWNQPQLMKDVSDLLFTAGAAALLVAVTIGVSRLPFFPIREVVITKELHEVRRVEIERSLSGKLHGNFFNINLDAFTESLEQLPWVRRAEARRQWPASIEVNIEEHVPVAFWGQKSGQLVNSHGEIFTVDAGAPPPEALPVLAGPSQFVVEMLGYYRQAAELLGRIGRQPRLLTVSPRMALQLKLDDGMIVELGRPRTQTKAPVHELLERFVEFYPSILTAAPRQPEVVDMRYPNGFALRAAVTPESEGRGKP